MSVLTPAIAAHILDRVGNSGEPPEQGLPFCTVGLEPYLSVIERDYFSAFIAQDCGGAAFKLLAGPHGGRTHFLYCIRDLAWRHNFVVAYLRLQPEENPLHQVDTLYKAIVTQLKPPPLPGQSVAGQKHGITGLLHAWFERTMPRYRATGFEGKALQQAIQEDLNGMIDDIESVSFGKAVRAAFLVRLSGRRNAFDAIVQWLTGEHYDQHIQHEYDIFRRIDRTTAMPMLRSLAQWIRKIGYAGLVILLDDAQQVAQMPKPQRQHHLYNLREFIDECGHARFQGMMVFYAIPDVGFLKGKAQDAVYEALRQRLDTVSATRNPAATTIELEAIEDPLAFLSALGTRLAWIYAAHHHLAPDLALVQQTIDQVAHTAYRERHTSVNYRRHFVQSLIRELDRLHQQGAFAQANYVNLSPNAARWIYHPGHGYGIVQNTTLRGHLLTVQFQQGQSHSMRKGEVEEVGATLAAVASPRTQPELSNGTFQARSAIEAFRLGIVPDAYLDSMTFGREEQTKALIGWLHTPNESSLMLVGNYGTGKTHLLKYFYGCALQEGFAVAHVEIDPNELPFHKPKRIYHGLMRTFGYLREPDMPPHGFLGFLEQVFAQDAHALDDHHYLRRCRGKLEDEQVQNWIMGLESPLPGLRDDMTAANIYCYMLSGIGWAAREVLGLRGLLLLFDEAEVLDLSYDTRTKKMGWNFFPALIATANDDERLLHAPEHTSFVFSGHEKTTPFLYKQPGGLKLLFAFTDESYKTHLDNAPRMIPLAPLNDAHLKAVFGHICALYQQAYGVAVDAVAAEDVLQRLTKKRYARTRMFVKGVVEALDLVRLGGR